MTPPPDAAHERTAPSPLLRLEPGGDSSQWRCVAEPHLCVGHPERQFLFGGTALAGCLTALERTLGLPVSFASAQFISFARPKEELRLTVRLVADGNSTKQAQVIARADERVVVAVQAALGRRESPLIHQGAAAPVVAPPLECPPASIARLLSSNLNNLIEVRLAGGRLPGRDPWDGPVPGPLLFWARARDGGAAKRQHLAIFADCFSIGIPAALGRNASGNSLDNHIRFIARPEGEWVLCAIDIEAVRDGLVHGHMRQYARNGQLLAIAGQSMILRV